MSISHLLSYSPSALPGYQDRNDAFRNAPINRLPYEILTEIFVYCTFSKYKTHAGYYRSDAGCIDYLEERGSLPELRADRAPLKLCHICGKWRNVVLSTPVLWSRFSLVSDVAVEQSLSSTFIEAQVWLLLSQKCQLTLSLDVKEPRVFSPDEQDHYELFLNLLRDTMHRWESVQIRAGAQKLIRHLKILEAEIETLERLHTVILTLRSGQRVSLSPHIRRLHIHIWIMPILDISSIPQLHRLEYLSIRGLKGMDAFAIINQCSRLKTLRLHIFSSDESPPDFRVTPKCHLSIEDISLEGPSDWITLLNDSISLPNLKRLTILERYTKFPDFSITTWRPRMASSALMMLDRSFTPAETHTSLESVDIRSSDFDNVQPEILIQLLRRHSHSLKSLAVAVGGPRNEYPISTISPLDALTSVSLNGEGPSICTVLEPLKLPRLKYIDLRSEEDDPTDLVVPAMDLLPRSCAGEQYTSLEGLSIICYPEASETPVTTLKDALHLLPNLTLLSIYGTLTFTNEQHRRFLADRSCKGLQEPGES